MDRNQKKLCPNCNVQVAAAHLARHRRTEKCLNFGSRVPVPEKRCPSCNQTITLPKKMVDASTQKGRPRVNGSRKRSSQKSDSTIESQASSGESKKRLTSDSKSCQKAAEQNSTETPQAPPQSNKRLKSDKSGSRRQRKSDSKSRQTSSDYTSKQPLLNDKSDKSDSE